MDNVCWVQTWIIKELCRLEVVYLGVYADINHQASFSRKWFVHCTFQDKGCEVTLVRRALKFSPSDGQCVLSANMDFQRAVWTRSGLLWSLHWRKHQASISWKRFVHGDLFRTSGEKSLLQVGFWNFLQVMDNVCWMQTWIIKELCGLEMMIILTETFKLCFLKTVFSSRVTQFVQLVWSQYFM